MAIRDGFVERRRPGENRRRWRKVAVPALAAAILALPPLAPARAEVLPGPVPAEVVQVIDGDTILVRARIWLGQVIETRVRLAGVDTPELRGDCAEEISRARAAAAFVSDIIGDGRLTLHDIRFGRYAGRVVARAAIVDGRDLSQMLLDAGLGRAYGGGAREGWC